MPAVDVINNYVKLSVDIGYGSWNNFNNFVKTDEFNLTIGKLSNNEIIDLSELIEKIKRTINDYGNCVILRPDRDSRVFNQINSILQNGTDITISGSFRGVWYYTNTSSYENISYTNTVINTKLTRNNVPNGEGKTLYYYNIFTRSVGIGLFFFVTGLGYSQVLTYNNNISILFCTNSNDTIINNGILWLGLLANYFSLITDYPITKAPGSESHAQLALSATSAAEGDTVTITATIDRGYDIDSILVLPDSVTGTVPVTRNGNVFTFTMPASAVTIYCEYSTKLSYLVTVDNTMENMTLTPTPTPAYEGETVTIAVGVSGGYKLQNVFAKNIETQEQITLVRTATATYTFTMPAANVILNGTASPIDSTDPLSPGGTSEPSNPEGGGDFDNETDGNPLPPLPSISIADSGMLTVFMPTKAQAESFGEWMWSDLFSTETLEKLGVNPMEYIISYHMIPLTPLPGETRQLKFLLNQSSVSMPIVAEQYPELNCGNLAISEYFGSALDYEPYTKASLYLPYIGEVPIKIDEIMGKVVNVRYRIDAYSGVGIAYVLIDDVVMYQYGCYTATQIPVTSANYMRYLSGILPVFGTIAGGVVGGVGGFLVGGEIAGKVQSGITGLTSAATAATEMAQGKSGVAEVMGGKGMVARSTGISGPTGNIATEYPYIIITRPKQSLPKDYNHYHGYALNARFKLSDINGYVKCSHVNADETTATDEELTEILTLLNGGVYL